MSLPVNARSRSLVNPFAAYAAGFSLALAVYSLGYSDLYPPLQPSLIWFLLVTSGICVWFAYFYRNTQLTAAPYRESLASHVTIFVAIVTAFVVEVLANRGIPLQQVLAGADISYRDFGLPVLHVAFSGFCYFFAVYWFDLYLQRRGRLFLVFSLCALSTSLLTLLRGAFVVTLIAIIAVYIQRRGLSKRLLVIFAIISGGFLWGFGFLGDIRTHGASGESVILSIGDASDKFRNSNIPTELFWPYLYASSPLANLQLNITDRVTNDSPGLYFILEYLPDFVSKRIVDESSVAVSSPILIVDQLTVSTMYGRSFVLLGWFGLWLTFFYFVMVSVICLKVLRNSKYLVATTGILSSLAFLAIFDNMYIVSGGILQALVAVLLKLFERNASMQDAVCFDGCL
jgi:hypothetical protein